MCVQVHSEFSIQNEDFPALPGGPGAGLGDGGDVKAAEEAGLGGMHALGQFQQGGLGGLVGLGQVRPHPTPRQTR